MLDLFVKDMGSESEELNVLCQRCRLCKDFHLLKHTFLLTAPILYLLIISITLKLHNSKESFKIGIFDLLS